MNTDEINRIVFIIKQNEAVIRQLNTRRILYENSARKSLNFSLLYMEKYRRLRKNKNRLIIKQLCVSATSFIPRNRNVWCFETFGVFWENEVPNFSNKKFKDRFRMDRETFNFICDKVGGLLKKEDTNWRKAIVVPKRVAIALYSLASSAEYATIAHLFGVGKSTVGEITLEVCEAINTLQNEFINGYPPTEEKIRQNIKGFHDTWGFPQCYSAIDGCHIEVSPCAEDATDYHNYKGWYSTVLFAAVDYRYRFTYINVGSPGRNNDAFIFANSQLKLIHTTDPTLKKFTKMINNIKVPVLLIGDSAFPLSNHVMKPFPYKNIRDEIEFNFNKVLSRSRRVVENAFGHLKARFRRIGKGLEVDIGNTNTIIRACCILHNICNCRNDAFNECWLIDDDEKTQLNFVSTVGERVTNATNLRRTLAEYIFTNERVEQN